MSKPLIVVCVALLLAVSSGCQYYRVNEATSGKSYITNNWRYGRNAFTGAIRFHDLVSGKEVVLTSYELQPISENAAKAEMGR